MSRGLTARQVKQFQKLAAGRASPVDHARPETIALPPLLDWPSAIDPATVLLALVVPGEPVSKGRARVVADGKVAYTPEATRDQERRIRERISVMQPAIVPDADHALGVRVRFIASNRQRRDLDNMVKLVLDALNRYAWADDVQIEELHSLSLHARDDAGTEILVYTVGDWRVPCESCGTRYRPTAGNRNRFCGKTCYDSAQRRGKYVHCAVCSTRIYRQAEKLTNRDNICSDKCRAALMAGRRVCRGCRKHLPDGATSRFCNTECSALFHAANAKDLEREHRYRSNAHCAEAQ